MGSIAKKGLNQYLMQLQQHPLRTKVPTHVSLYFFYFFSRIYFSFIKTKNGLFVTLSFSLLFFALSFGVCGQRRKLNESFDLFALFHIWV
uniref:Uncharacterized protein n=1 Tax=Cannabis sativa TaxID=3483 RepID=A0A803QW32_CANSA